MSKTYIPVGYRPALNTYQTQKAIGLIKRIFEDNLCGSLGLQRVSAPMFVDVSTGLNDDLNGTERAVNFDIPEITGTQAAVVHSLAKWKRKALKDYGFSAGRGLVTDMNAIRRDEKLDNIHSIYVDQWDWEKIITAEQRNTNFLKENVNTIVECICNTKNTLDSMFPQLHTNALTRNVTFITAQELENLYPDLTAKERENVFAEKHGTIFIMGIGGKLSSGFPHDGRAPDYDDWQLNGDIIFWNDVLKCAFEISSMGIRVDSVSLDRQLNISGCDNRRDLPYHRALLNGELPLTIGGGIGQSRLCMLLLGNAHIGEVQVSLWDNETREICEAAGIPLL